MIRDKQKKADDKIEKQTHPSYSCTSLKPSPKALRSLCVNAISNHNPTSTLSMMLLVHHSFLFLNTMHNIFDIMQSNAPCHNTKIACIQPPFMSTSCSFRSQCKTQGKLSANKEHINILSPCCNSSHIGSHLVCHKNTYTYAQISIR